MNLTDFQAKVLEEIIRDPQCELRSERRTAAKQLRDRNLIRRGLHGWEATVEGLAASGRTLTSDLDAKIDDEIVMMLHAHRDCLRNGGVDTTIVRFHVNDGYYGEVRPGQPRHAER